MRSKDATGIRQRYDILFVAVVVAAGTLLAAGAYARYAELEEGVDAGTNNTVTWGLLVVNYVLFIGLSAGGVIIASLVYILNVQRFKPIATFAELLAIISIILVPVFIFYDLGQPERAQNLILFGRIESPLVWTVIVLTTYLVTCLVYLYYGVRRELVALSQTPGRLRWLYRLILLGYHDTSAEATARDECLVRRIAFVALPLAVVLHSVTGLIFAVVNAKPGYNTALMPPLFVVSAVVSGIALVALVVVVAGHRVGLPVAPGTVEDLGRILALLLPILGYLLLVESTVVFYGTEQGSLDVWRYITLGGFAPLFWIMVVLGLLVPFAILLPRRTRTPQGVAVASALILVGVFSERYLIVLTPLLFPSLPAEAQTFAPTATEVTMVLGVYALGILLFALATKLFPVGKAYAQLHGLGPSGGSPRALPAATEKGGGG